MNKIITILLLISLPIFNYAQKLSVVFNAGGVPEELTLVDSNGVRAGYSNIYNSRGILTMSLMYKNGVPNGQWSKYNENTGKLQESFTYVNGKLNGEHIWWDESGKVIKCIVFKNGVRINYPKAESLWALNLDLPSFLNSLQPIG